MTALATPISNPTPGIQIPESAAAGSIATSIINQTNAFVTRIDALINNGVTASGPAPAVSADALKTALGPVLPKLQAAIAALSA